MFKIKNFFKQIIAFITHSFTLMKNKCCGNFIGLFFFICITIGYSISLARYFDGDLLSQLQNISATCCILSTVCRYFTLKHFRSGTYDLTRIFLVFLFQGLQILFAFMFIIFSILKYIF